jgi:hypothetical protein
MSQLLDLLHRRRVVARERDALATNDALYDTARELRRRAQAHINAGHPELAAPYLDEARMWESAAQHPGGL